MVMKLYGMKNIFNVQRAIVPLFEAGTEKELELVHVNLFTHDNDKPNFLAKHPFGLIPYLEDGDVKIYESRAIARYIAEKYEGQGAPNMGRTLKERAAINQWVETEAHVLYPPLAPMLKELYVAGALNRPLDEELVASCTAALVKVLDVYEAHLVKGSKYLTGDEYNFADACHTPYLYQVKIMKAEVLRHHPYVWAYTDAITERPGFQKLLQLDWDNAPSLE
ncbi:glutathione S-transferase F9 [Physcomitrium patens]|uniref:glutathione transferase n=1 Tax=Physcomitrium patens TaxID=3218 RepID=K9Y423_PHYPA|nr:glutathione S-transferase F9-like [Physcomitrium patens]AFZ39131.1 phi class glutathione S-transferase [Physcomitrium patens]PNR35861.1 hypothetical protein PHYPA_021711 [Physcomitrium patens]|eukprot:XP_024400594.1 glutathione S-transferase F9-like [Physcomitrella patens]